jgi:curved DNA-binding protein CbpA
MPPEGVEPSFELETEAFSQILETLDYYEVLKIPKSATPGQIRDAFQALTRLYHPDRYFAYPDSLFKDQVLKVYKRITEAYVILRDDRKRQKYLADVTGADRGKRLRFTEEDEAETRDIAKRKIEEQIGHTPKGRQLYQLAMRDVEAGRNDSAIRNLRMASSFEPENQLFKDKLRELEKARGPDFHIKLK